MIVFIGYPKTRMKPMKWYYSFSNTSKEIQLIVPGVDVASGITPEYPRMTIRQWIIIFLVYKECQIQIILLIYMHSLSNITETYVVDKNVARLFMFVSCMRNVKINAFVIVKHSFEILVLILFCHSMVTFFAMQYTCFYITKQNCNSCF